MSSKKVNIYFDQLVYRVAIFGFLLFTIMACGDQEDPSEKLLGTWQRTDGTYKIVIEEVLPDGEMTAKYLNPKSINVGKSSWTIQDEVLHIYVELRDENYPGSLYKLVYNDKNQNLTGTYYQAVARETYNISFKKIK